LLLCSCRAPGPVDLDRSIADAGKIDRPLVLYIGEFGEHGADAAQSSLLCSGDIADRAAGIQLITMNLGVSRNRAEAARYHVVKTPMLVCLSPRGLIVSRDEAPITKELVQQRMTDLGKRAAALDQQFAKLDEPENTKQLDPGYDQAHFLLVHHNAREAIPYLKALSESETVSTKLRIDAWVSLARAHLWVAEPEKGRHEAKALIATLGPLDPAAIAGGNLVLGLQDAAAKRFSLARREFETAIAAAPGSTYAAKARAARDQLPKE
jgi:hypothetical protein